jgi:hypothetical protein
MFPQLLSPIMCAGPAKTESARKYFSPGKLVHFLVQKYRHIPWLGKIQGIFLLYAILEIYL